jgi:hypothetical protein
LTRKTTLDNSQTQTPATKSLPLAAMVDDYGQQVRPIPNENESWPKEKGQAVISRDE